MANPEIFCPKCGYRPQPEDRWSCMPSCGTLWHTFWTGGVCPGCSYRWPVTQCPRCGEISPHKSWYHFPQSSERSRKNETTTPEETPA